jgi:hypothetical protein
MRFLYSVAILPVIMEVVPHVSPERTFILESNYPMTLTRFALECSKQCTNATYLDMGEYGYGYIKQGSVTIPLFAPAIFTQHKQTNWIYIE